MFPTPIIIPFYFVGDESLLFQFQIFAGKTKYRDLLVGHYSWPEAILFCEAVANFDLLF